MNIHIYIYTYVYTHKGSSHPHRIREEERASGEGLISLPPKGWKPRLRRGGGGREPALFGGTYS